MNESAIFNIYTSEHHRHSIPSISPTATVFSGTTTKISTVAAAPPPRNKLRTQLKCIEIQLSGSYLELGSTEVCWQRGFSDLSSIQFSKPIFAEMS